MQTNKIRRGGWLACKMFLKKQIFKINVLKNLLAEENSCVTLVSTSRLLALPPCFLNDIKKGIFFILNNALKKYDQNLDGILIGYQNVKILMDEKTGLIPMGVAEIRVNVSVEFYIFQPKIGGLLKGVVNKKSSQHIGCLVHKYFNATILRPEDVDYDMWECKDFNVDDCIKFRVKDLDFTGVLPRIEGTIVDLDSSDNNNLKGINSEIRSSSASDDINCENKLLESEEFWKVKLNKRNWSFSENDPDHDLESDSQSKNVSKVKPTENNKETDDEAQIKEDRNIEDDFSFHTKKKRKRDGDNNKSAIDVEKPQSNQLKNTSNAKQIDKNNEVEDDANTTNEDVPFYKNKKRKRDSDSDKNNSTTHVGKSQTTVVLKNAYNGKPIEETKEAEDKAQTKEDMDIDEDVLLHKKKKRKLDSDNNNIKSATHVGKPQSNELKNVSSTKVTENNKRSEHETQTKASPDIDEDVSLHKKKKKKKNSDNNKLAINDEKSQRNEDAEKMEVENSVDNAAGEVGENVFSSTQIEPSSKLNIDFCSPIHSSSFFDKKKVKSIEINGKHHKSSSERMKNKLEKKILSELKKKILFSPEEKISSDDIIVSELNEVDLKKKFKYGETVEKNKSSKDELNKKKKFNSSAINEIKNSSSSEVNEKKISNNSEINESKNSNSETNKKKKLNNSEITKNKNSSSSEVNEKKISNNSEINEKKDSSNSEVTGKKNSNSELNDEKSFNNDEIKGEKKSSNSEINEEKKSNSSEVHEKKNSNYSSLNEKKESNSNELSEQQKSKNSEIHKKNSSSSDLHEKKKSNNSQLNESKKSNRIERNPKKKSNGSEINEQQISNAGETNEKKISDNSEINVKNKSISEREKIELENKILSELKKKLLLSPQEKITDNGISEMDSDLTSRSIGQGEEPSERKRPKCPKGKSDGESKSKGAKSKRNIVEKGKEQGKGESGEEVSNAESNVSALYSKLLKDALNSINLSEIDRQSKGKKINKKEKKMKKKKEKKSKSIDSPEIDIKTDSKFNSGFDSSNGESIGTLNKLNNNDDGCGDDGRKEKLVAEKKPESSDSEKESIGSNGNPRRGGREKKKTNPDYSPLLENFLRLTMEKEKGKKKSKKDV